MISKNYIVQAFDDYYRELPVWGGSSPLDRITHSPIVGIGSIVSIGKLAHSIPAGFISAKDVFHNRSVPCSIQGKGNPHPENAPNKKKAGHIARWAGLKRFLGVGMVGVRRQSCRLDKFVPEKKSGNLSLGLNRALQALLCQQSGKSGLGLH